MPRKRKTDFWADALPSEMEWVLGILFLGVWVFASIGYYWGILGQIERLMDIFVPLGVKPDESVFRPMLDMAFRLAPLVGFAVAFRAWRWARGTLLRSVAAPF